MRSIDIHAHITPQCFWRATSDGGSWHGLRRERDGQGQELLVSGQERGQLPPKSSWTPEQRLADMDSLGVDVHVISPFAGLYNYHLDTALAVATSRETNDEIGQMTQSWPDRFAGLATLPMQDVDAAVAELDRVMVQMGFKGVVINDHVNGRLLDESEFLPFWQAAEQLGALILFHQGGDTVVSPRIRRLPPSQYDREPGGPDVDLRVPGDRRRDGRLSRPENLPVSWRRVRLLRRRPHGSRLARAE